MSVVRLKVKNFLSIADVEINSKQVNIITGKNNQGKTSILKALEFAIKGSTDGTLVRFGEDQAEVIVELDDKTLIRRKLSADGKQKVELYKEDFKAQMPQTVLDSLFETSSFNPLELLDPKKRTDAILSSIDLKLTEEILQSELGAKEFEKVPLPPLDYSKHGLKVLEEAHKYFYQRRAEANKIALEKKKRWETYAADLPKEDTPLSFTAQDVEQNLQSQDQKLKAAEAELKSIEQTHTEFKDKKERYEKYLKAVDEIDVEINKHKAEIEKQEARKAEGLKFVESARKEIPDAIQDTAQAKARVEAIKLETEKIRGQKKELEAQDEKSKRRSMVDGCGKEYQESQAVADSLTKRVEALAGPIKKKLLESVEMPVAGLEFKDDAIVVDGVPVDNLSSSKAMRLAVAVARKHAKKTKLICIDGAEALDADTYESFRCEIEGDGYTYFLTKVGEGFHNPKDHVIHMDQGQVTV